MTPHRKKVIAIVLGSVAGLLSLLVIVGIIVSQSQWFRDYVRDRIVASVESSTGGRVELGAFSFDWRHLRVEIRDFTLHGTEGPGEEPLLHAASIVAELKFLSLADHKALDIASVDIRAPQANLIIYPDGRTNVPQPKVAQQSDQSALATVVDLAIGRFSLSQGSLHIADRKIPFSAQGENLAVQMAYNMASGRYSGQIVMNPMYAQYAGNQRANLNVDVHVVLGRDRVEINSATMATSNSKIQVSGAIDHLVSPQASVKLAGQIDLTEMKQYLGAALPVTIPNGSPHVLDAHIEGSLNPQELRLVSAKLGLGKSSIDASGNARNVRLEGGTMQFRAQLALAELARILDPAIQAAGEIDIGGQAHLNGFSDYQVEAALAGNNVALRRGDVHVSNIALSSKIAATPGKIDLRPFALRAVGGEINGTATLANFSQYRANASISHLNVQDLVNIIRPQRIGYSAVISGPVEVAGDLKRPNSLKSTAQLNLSPGNNSVPVSGNINVDYDGPRDTVNLRNSYIALPASRLDFSGALSSQIDIHLLTRNLEDFRPALSMVSTPPNPFPVQIDRGGSANIDAKVAGRLSAPNISAHLAINKFRVEQRRFDQLSANLTASESRVAIDNATLSRDSLMAAFHGIVGLDHWSIKPNAPLMVDANVQNADLLDALAFAGATNVPVSGNLGLQAQVSGTVGNPQGSANVRVTKGMAYGEPLDLVQGQLDYAGQKASITSLVIESGAARANLNATFEHPPENFSEGKIQLHVNTNQVGLARLHAIQNRNPGLDGSVQANLDANLALEPKDGKPALRLVAVNGTLEGRGLRREGRNFGDLTARVQTSGDTVAFQLASDFAGSNIMANGETNLMRNYETSASLNIQNLPIQDALAVAGRKDVAASGLLSAKGDVNGVFSDLRADMDLNLTKAVLRRQPLDRFEGHLNYSNTLVELDRAVAQAGASRITLSASFSHPAGNYSSGDIKVQTQSNPVQLSQIVYLKDWKPGIGGTMQFSIDSAVKLQPSGSAQRVTISNLNARATVAGLRADGRDYGGLSVTAAGSGASVTAKLESNLAQSSITADVRVDLSANYPVNGKLSFSGVRYVNWAGLLPTSDPSPAFDALLEGSATFSGPALKPENLTGTAELTKAELYATAPGTTKASPELALRNDGPVIFAADRSVVQVKQARWSGPSTKLSVSGNVALRPLALNLNLNADADLALLHRISDEISSEGHVLVNASVKGTPSQPVLQGRVELKNAAYQTSDMPNGISKANGVILLAGTSANIQSLTAESGGGRLTVDGAVVRYDGEFRFGLRLRANGVQIRTESGASAGVDADIRLSGTQRASAVSGAVTVHSVGFSPRTDFGTILAQTVEPAPTPATPHGFLAGARLDVSVKTAPGASFQTIYTTSLDASANLNMRGTLANPAAVGRVTISSGDVVFFGTKYKLNSGSVSFYNPNKIEPILDLNLSTTARGVQVTLNVTGPIDNMNLAYQSDPPLQFSEIVGLLAAGRMPTSDPVLVAHQPTVPAQSVQQLGESAVLSQAVANPLSSQLKRVFGVTELKIDPTFTSGSELPQARLTLQQKVTEQLTFTYITDLTSADSQILRAEWALNARWSAVATRQENGLVGIDVFYKRRFH